MTTKEKIRDAALRLFTAEGTENVTTRHIAAEIGISQGNLHYHYPNRNAVIQALFDEFVTKATEMERYKGQGFSKEQMLASMRDNFRLMYRYRFIHRDREVIARRVPEIHEAWREIIARKRMQVQEIIRHYQSLGHFREEISEAQIQSLLDHFLFLIVSWIDAVGYLGQEPEPSDGFAEMAFRIWLPYLVPDEMREWEGLLSGPMD